MRRTVDLASHPASGVGALSHDRENAARRGRRRRESDWRAHARGTVTIKDTRSSTVRPRRWNRQNSVWQKSSSIMTAITMVPMGYVSPDSWQPYRCVPGCWVLGAGGMGEVYRARDLKLGREVAIKILPAAFQSDPDRLARFEREARLLAALNHPNIAAIYGVEDSAGIDALVLELVEGRHPRRTISAAGPVADQRSARHRAADRRALEAAHEKGIVHRDLKPANIKITPERRREGAGLRAGESRDELRRTLGADAADDDRCGDARQGSMLGTAAYMSPEQARGQAVDKRTDIWAFGCVLFEMLTGRPPFAGATMSDIDRGDPRPRSGLDGAAGRDPAVGATAAAALSRKIRGSGCATSAKCRSRSTDDGAHVAKRSQRSLVMAFAALIACVGLVAVCSSTAIFLSGCRASRSADRLQRFHDRSVALSRRPHVDVHSRRGIRRFRGARPSLRQDPASGEPVQLTRDLSIKEQPVFTPDGSRIVYTAVSRLEMGFVAGPVLGGAPQPFLPNASGLVWLDERQLMYAKMTTGVHMGIVTSTESRSEHRRIYFPSGENGMAHRSVLSPDHKSLLIVEMDGGAWLPCRLMPFDASTTGRPVGPPNAQCTTAAWSPDGAWDLVLLERGDRVSHLAPALS